MGSEAKNSAGTHQPTPAETVPRQVRESSSGKYPAWCACHCEFGSAAVSLATVFARVIACGPWSALRIHGQQRPDAQECNGQPTPNAGVSEIHSRHRARSTSCQHRCVFTKFELPLAQGRQKQDSDSYGSPRSRPPGKDKPAQQEQCEDGRFHQAAPEEARIFPET